MSRPQATVRRVGRRPTANPKSEIVSLTGLHSEFRIQNSEFKEMLPERGAGRPPYELRGR
jgi:hypothetical protein